MNTPKSSLTLPQPPVGLSFELSDLIIVLGWSEFHDPRMVVELDHYSGGEDSEFRRWSMWRTNEGIVVQPTVGRTRRFSSVAGSLEALIPAADQAADLNTA